MKTFQVKIYRNGGWFRRFVEDWTVEADEYGQHNNVVYFFKDKESGNKCLGFDQIASFAASEYSVIQIK